MTIDEAEVILGSWLRPDCPLVADELVGAFAELARQYERCTAGGNRPEDAIKVRIALAALKDVR